MSKTSSYFEASVSNPSYALRAPSGTSAVFSSDDILKYYMNK